jgi:hypothetical protein
MVTFQIQAVTVSEPATGRNIDLKMRDITENELHTVTGKISRILIQQLQIHTSFAV